MAKVYLRNDGGRDVVDLPPVCMKCGAPATVRKFKKFTWTPPWVSALAIVPLAYIIVSSIVTKRQRVETTFCEQHKSYWWMYPLVMWMLALGVLGLGLLACFALAASGKGGGGDYAAAPCGLSVVALVVLLIAAAIINSNMRIRPHEITDRHIHLGGVSQEFADAVDDEDAQRRRAFDRDDDDDRGRRRPRSDDPRFET